MAGLSPRDTNVRSQSSLGTEYTRRYKDSSNIDRISLGRVTRVNYRYNTVDVTSGSIGGDFSSSSVNGGKYSAKLPVQFGGTTPEGKPFGQVNPIEVGTLVLLGFIEGQKTTPIVLAIYGREEESVKLSRTPFEGADPEDEKLKPLTQQQFTVYPSLTYENIDGVGNRTVSFTGKSFITTESDSSPEMGGLTDAAEGTAYEDLDSSYYFTGELIEPNETRAPVILFKHQGAKFARNEEGKQEDGHNFMWFIDQDGTYRTSMMQENEDWRSYFEMKPDGTIQMVRQNDSKDVDSSSDRFSIGVEKDGIRFRVGDKYSLITPTGTYGNLGLGAGGGEGLPSGILDEINETLDLANRRILEMGTYIEQTEAFIAMGAHLIEDLEDGMATYEANFRVLAEEIKLSVSETVLRDLVTEELDAFMGDLDDLVQDANEHLEILEGIVSDGLITPVEKELLAPKYQAIKVEYPAYLAQAEKNGKETAAYERAYRELVDLMEPIMEDSNSTSSVDPIDVLDKYQNYFTTRQGILSGILTELQKDVTKAVQEASKAGLDAQKALGQSADAFRDANNALSSLSDIARTDRVTPQEKPGLRSTIEEIRAEYPGIIEQASEFEVSYLSYENAYESLDGFIESTGIFKDMSETTELNGEMFYQLVEDYYRERIAVHTAIAKQAKSELRQVTADFEYYNTMIIETAREIALIAQSVVANEDSVRIAQARLSIMADRASLSVSKSTFKREIDENRNTLNATGKNLFVQATGLEGYVINPSTGVTEPSSEGMASAYIQVSGGVRYTLSIFDNETSNTVSHALYDASGRYLNGDSSALGGGDENTNHTILAPSNARFLRVSLSNYDPAKIQVERGSGSGFYMYSNQDLLDNLDFATKEKETREISWQDKSTRRGKALEEASIFLMDLEAILEDSELTVSEANLLTEEIGSLVDEFDTILSEAGELDLQTINLEIAIAQLEAINDQYIKPVVDSGEPSSLSPADREIIQSGFTTYLNRREAYYSLVEDMFKASYEASVEVLDEVLAGSLEAERIAREAAMAAERAAQSVSTIEYEISMGNTMENNHIDTARRISEDGVLDPVEKEEGMSLLIEITNEIDWLLSQGRAVGLGTQNLENAYNQLSSYYSAFVTADKLLEDSAVNSQTFVGNFQAYHSAKLSFLEGLLLEAQHNLTQSEEDAKLARDETYRRDEALNNLRNIIDDSELAIERIEKKVEDLTNTAYFVIEVLSTNGFTFKDRVVNTTLETTVYQATNDITETIPNENFEWVKIKDNGDEDVAWTEEHKGVGPKIDLTHEDVQGRATFIVEVYIEEEESDG